ncbi:MAG: VPS10 domain-containing protein [Candidatus Saccharicenans sp.]
MSKEVLFLFELSKEMVIKNRPSFELKKRGLYSLKLVAALILLLIYSLSVSYSYPQAKPEEILNKFITWRNIGPAVMGGRTVDLEAVEKQPYVIYAAVGPSGAWKSENNGTTWYPIFYKEATVSVGAIAVAQSSPNIIWVGTGEATCRNSVTVGDGVYKSTDGGKTWTNMGLKDTKHISRILISRGDANVVYVAAMGHLWGPNAERGIYKTIDGGKTWTKVLYINENTGFADLAMDPDDSQILYAAAYEHRRYPYKMVSGGPGSGIYKTTDGGLTWKKLSKDLPEGLMGRIGLAVARTKPGVVYALIEHQDPGIWRSEDYGETWKRTAEAKTYKTVNNRPFYYSRIYVNPQDDRTIYVQSTGLYVSNDMGQKFKSIGGGIHPDHHALWIDPANLLHLIDGNDGGIDITYDGGKTWLPITSLDSAEVYQVGFDFGLPYKVYCGLQDNGCWGGPSNSLDSRGILNEHWVSITGGDGFFIRPDPQENFIVYSNSQNNGLGKTDLRHGLTKDIRPEAPLNEPPYRFNWNAPIMISPHDHKTIYCGGNFLFKSIDGGYSWEKISPDLTTNDKLREVDGVGPITMENSGAEVNCTITAIAESPVRPGVLWCGTDDGNLQISQDGGRNWTNVIKNIPGLPANSWCSRIEASHFDPGTAYVSFDNHRRDDYIPYLYKTTDFGKTWKSIKNNLPDFGWVHVIREHPSSKNLLFVGTEFGIYASLDSGLSWINIKGINLPTVSVNDIAIHPRENDLIIGTHGRGIWILDDIGFISELNSKIIDSDFYLFNIQPAFNLLMANRGEAFSTPPFAGKNPASGAKITYFIKKDLSGDIRIKILDAQKKTIIELPLNKKAGINRTYWNLQFIPEASDGKKYPLAGQLTAMCYVTPGDYQVAIKIGENEFSQPLKVNPDPRFEINSEAIKKQYPLIGDLTKVNYLYARAITATKNINRDLESIKTEINKITDQKTKEEIINRLNAFQNNFEAVSQPFNTEGTLAGLSIPYEQFLRGPLNMRLISLQQSISSYPGEPTLSETQQVKEISDYILTSIEKLNNFLQKDLIEVNQFLEKYGLSKIKKAEPIKPDIK